MENEYVILKKMLRLVRLHSKASLMSFKKLVSLGKVDLNQYHSLSSIMLRYLFSVMNDFDVAEASICYELADIIADLCKSIDYTSLLDLTIDRDSGNIHPSALAVLLKHGADIKAVDENGLSYYDLIKRARETELEYLEENPSDIGEKIFNEMIDCSFRMAYHANEGSINKVDYFLNRACVRIEELRAQNGNQKEVLNLPPAQKE